MLHFVSIAALPRGSYLALLERLLLKQFSSPLCSTKKRPDGLFFLISRIALVLPSYQPRINLVKEGCLPIEVIGHADGMDEGGLFV